LTDVLETFCRQVRERSLEHRRALQALADANTPGVLTSILRQELDSMVRLIFLLTQDDRGYRNQLIDASVNGQRWRRRGSKEKITDREMVDLANEFHGWTAAVYKFGCAFIHLSSQHDYGARDPFLALPSAEQASVISYLRYYHHGHPSTERPTFQDIIPLLPEVFEKVAANLECCLNDLEADKTIER
jgi:hypothetical protein